MTDKITTVVDLLKVAKPKNVCVLLEVPVGHTYENVDDNGRNVDRLSKILDVVEEGVIDPRIPMTTHLVMRRDVKKGDAQILPMFAFHDPKVKMRTVMTYDIVIVKCLDNKHLIVKVPEGVDLPPYTKLD